MGKNFTYIFIIIVFVFGGILYVYNPKPNEYENPKDQDIVCTMEVKMCPDGSYVGRQGPDCEFAKCPSTSTPVFIPPSEEIKKMLENTDQEEFLMQ